MTKQITILTTGSQGDIQPYMALAGGLQSAGYKVRIATNPEYEPAIVDRGIEFAPISGSPSELLETELGLNWINTENHPLRFAIYFVRIMRPHLEEQLPDYMEACQGSDLIIYSRLGVAAMYVAEKLGVPGIFASVQPLGRTRYLPAVGAHTLPKWLPGKSIYNYLSHLVVEQLFWLPFRGIINRWRREQLGLPPAPRRSTYAQIAAQGGPLIQAHSEILLPSPPDWPEWLHTTGFWMLEHKTAYRPSEKLLAFLESGPPPVQIGYGSMRFQDQEKMMKLSLEALEKSGQRGILNISWADVDQLSLPPTVIATNYVPFDWLFPRLSAVVHHGGIGTTQLALRAGIPSIVVPFFSEQQWWARRVAELGAGIEMPPPRRLTSDSLAEAIRLAVNDPEMYRNAQKIGLKLSQEDGVGNAVALIRQYV